MRLFVWLAMALLIAMPARAELVIEITRGVENPIKIAVVPFRVKSAGAFDVDLARLIESNLERSGQFIRVRRDTMLSLPGPEDEIFYRDWRAILRVVHQKLMSSTSSNSKQFVSRLS